MIELWDVSDIKVLDIEYIDDGLLECEEFVQSDLRFKKNNSLYAHLTLLVPVHTSQKIFETFKNPKSDISVFFSNNVRLLSDSIIFLYNKSNSRSYIGKTKSNISVFVSNECYKKNLYKVVFKLSGKKMYLYFDIDKAQLFV